MRLINPSFEILDTNGYDINGIYKDIERAARTCYKSEINTTEDSAKKMVDSLIKRGHTSCLEHGTVYLRMPSHIVSKYIQDKYSVVKSIYEGIDYLNPYKYDSFVTTNLRVLQQNDWLDDLQYLCEPTVYHEKRYSVRFICDRGVSHEIVRSRSMSFAQESQRYCNYSKDKFNNEVTFIIPSWLDTSYFTEEELNHFSGWMKGSDIVYGDNLQPEFHFVDSLSESEHNYFKLLDKGWSPQQARAVLPNATKTEIIVTGFASDWDYFFSLRADGVTGKPHPDMEALAKPLKEEFIKRGYIK